MHELRQDLRFGLRLLLRKPAISALAILILAIGIGANAAIYSLVQGILLRALPYSEPDRLAMIWLDNRRQNIKEDLPSYPMYMDWKKANSFVTMAPMAGGSAMLTSTGDPEQLRMIQVPAEMFDVLGVRPAIGRAFSKDEEQDGKDRVIVLYDAFWRHRFGADRSIIGKDVDFDGQKMTVIGVMPESFRFVGTDVAFLRPLVVSPRAREARFNYWLRVVARLKPGISFTQAQAELSSIASNMEIADPRTKGYGAYVVPLHRQVVGDTETPLLILFGAVALVLLIACTNVASLFLARAEEREREIAVRTALGASRSRLIRMMLIESGVTAVVSGMLGIALAYGSLQALAAYGPKDLPRAAEISIDGGVMLFALAASLLTGLLFGLMPALQASRFNLNESLRDGGRGASAGRRARFLRSTLVVAEFALAVVLLAGSGLLIRSLIALQGVPSGFETDHALVMRISAPRSRYPQGPQLISFYSQLTERLKSVPGVTAVGGTTSIFLTATPDSGGFTIENHPPIPADQQIEATVDSVTPGYFAAAGTPLLRGRMFDAGDTADKPGVILINDTFAKRFWPNEDPVGKRLVFGTPGPKNPWYTIVGVVGDERRMGLDIPARCESFGPLAQGPSRTLNVVVRASGDPTAVAGALRSVVQEIDRTVPIQYITPFETLFGENAAQRRFQTLLLGVFAGIALLLASIGIYALMYQAVTRRTQEIGVRLALGAQRSDVLKMVLNEGLTLAAIGIGIGIAAALALTRLLASLLFGVTSTDPVAFGAAIGVLLTAAAFAAYLPARRATDVDPMEALRYE
ncbi:MAG: ABC transporter permease [Bryobacteraceae bacterium]